YKCVCGRGTNDTSNGKGRSCEGVLVADGCVRLFGICIFFWILLLVMLLLLPLLCCIGWFLYRHHKAAKERDEQVRLFKDLLPSHL
uniref:EGF-like domain-containing protein n=1 Tax=Parascaris univalens TaxID=6257 RepID=A0A915C9G0_PARUN